MKWSNYVETRRNAYKAAQSDLEGFKGDCSSYDYYRLMVASDKLEGEINAYEDYTEKRVEIVEYRIEEKAKRVNRFKKERESLELDMKSEKYKNMTRDIAYYSGFVEGLKLIKQELHK